jgi:hypothetical protein
MAPIAVDAHIGSERLTGPCQKIEQAVVCKFSLEQKIMFTL